MGLVVGDVGEKDRDGDQVLRPPTGLGERHQHVAEGLPKLLDDATPDDLHVGVQRGLPAQVERVTRQRAVRVTARCG